MISRFKQFSPWFAVVVATALLVGCGAFNNGSGDDDDDDNTQPSTTIFQVQNPADPDHPDIDTVVYIEGVLVSAVIPDTDRTHFFLQDPAGGDYSGIYVYDQNGVTPAGLTIGDEINIEATYTEFNGASQLVLSNDVNLVEVVNTGVTLPFTSVAAADIGQIATGGSRSDALEGVLLQIDGDVTVANPAVNNFGEFTVSNGSDELLVDDYIYADAEVGRSAGESFTNLRGVLYFAFDEFKLEPRNTDDIPAGEVQPVTAYAIQDPNHPNHVGENSTVILENMVVTGVAGAGDSAFAVQTAEADWDASYGAKFSGMYIYRPMASSPTVAVGDVVTVEGTVTEFFDLTEISADTVTVTGAGAGVMPTAAVVADPASIATGGADAEAYESVLIQVTADVAVLNPDDDGMGQDFGEVEFTGGLRMDDAFFGTAEDAPRAAGVGASFTITGVHSYSFSNFKVLPTSGADIVQN